MTTRIHMATASALLMAAGLLACGAPSPSAPDRDAAERFPSERFVTGLLSKPERIPGVTSVMPNLVCFTDWFDGEPRLIYGGKLNDPAFKEAQSLRVARQEVEQFERLWMEHEWLQCQTVTGPEKSPLLLAAVREAGHPTNSATTLVGLGSDLKRLWAYSPPAGLQANFTVLFNEDGPCGSALVASGPSDLVALDLAGKESWRLPEHFVVYRLRTHRALPGLLMSVGGDVSLVHHTGLSAEAAPMAQPERAGGMYVYDGVLFPDQEGLPAVVVSAVDYAEDGHIVCRVRTDGSVAWRANVPSKIRYLAMIEPEGRPRIVFAASVAGVLYALDERGALLGRAEVPRKLHRDVLGPFGLAAGQFGLGRWAVAVSFSHGAYLYHLDLGALDASEAR